MTLSFRDLLLGQHGAFAPRARRVRASKYAHVSGSRAASRPVRDPAVPIQRMRQVWVAPDGTRTRRRREPGSIRVREPR